jgi:hypothetical protein
MQDREDLPNAQTSVLDFVYDDVSPAECLVFEISTHRLCPWGPACPAKA